MNAAIYAAVALVVGAASLFAASAWLKAGSYVCLVVALFGLWWVSLGQPRPALFGVPKGTVVAYSLDEPRAIYVWLRPEGEPAPVGIALPWREREAVALHKAARQAKETGEPLKMRGRAGGAGIAGLRHVTPVFYPAPAPALPPKQRP